MRRVREAGATPGVRILRAGPLHVDLSAHHVSVNGEERNLTPTEFRLLVALMERRDRAQSRKQLLERAWDVGADEPDRLETCTLDMHIRRLRGKLGEVGDWIQTIRGFGCRIKVPEGMP